MAAVAPGVCLCFVPKAGKDAAPLREGRVDLEIGVLSGMGPEIRLQALSMTVLSVWCGRVSAAANGGSEVIAMRPMGMVSLRYGKAQGPVDSALAEHGLQRKIAAIVPGYSAAMSVVQHLTSLLRFLLPGLLASRCVLVKGYFRFCAAGEHAADYRLADVAPPNGS